ncbi:MAG TPA: zinc-binding dehydrogenase [Thermoanaerobaculia bacterium]|nr:zinc-binding dehydrogenase [Thermoanaerobaculia bacterium]
MRAVRLLRAGSRLEDAELPEPVAGEGETRVRIEAAGICHSDAHYRDGAGRVNLPLTLGHEIAGVVEETGQRVALHYLLPDGDMLGKERDGGYAESIVVPSANLVPVPDEVPFDEAAVMMCSTATAYHALRLASPVPGQSVAILGLGGLGVSAAQLARVAGAGQVFAVDVRRDKLAHAASFGATPLDDAGALRNIDVVLDFAGHAPTTLTALRALAFGGRLVVVAINLRSLEFDPYADVLVRQRSIIGCSDHTREELVELMELARTKRISLAGTITRRVGLDAAEIDAVLDDLVRGTPHLRTVITPTPRGGASSCARTSPRPRP